MRDRVPTPGRENRVKITQDDGTVVAGVLEYDDQATQEGSPYTRGNVLPDDVCNAYNLDKVTSEPKDAFLAVPGIMGKALLTITVTKINGQPYPGVVVNGLSNIDTPRRTTNSEGKVVVYVDAGTYNLTFAPSPVCVDTSIPGKQVVVSAGAAISVTTQEASKGLTNIDITSSQKVGFSANVQNLDIFLVGGGGGGGGSESLSHKPAGGGGGGRTKTQLNVSFTPYISYNAIIGNGGNGGSVGANGGTGGTTSFLGISAIGGNGGKGVINDNYANGGDGGSGGGAGGGNGGDDGSDGEDSGNNASGGQGQGTTTRAFGETTGQIYSGGGGGGLGYGGTGGGDGGGVGIEGYDATGYGGGGGGGTSTSHNPTSGRAGGKGYQGIIKLRWVNAS